MVQRSYRDDGRVGVLDQGERGSYLGRNSLDIRSVGQVGVRAEWHANLTRANFIILILEVITGELVFEREKVDMNTNWMAKKSLSTSARKLFQGFFALLFALSLMGLRPPQAVQAAAYTWVAYNDSVSGTSQHTTANTTTIAYNGSGQLRRQSDGSNTGITAAFTSNGTISSTSNGVDANSSTDAYNTFYPYCGYGRGG